MTVREGERTTAGAVDAAPRRGRRIGRPLVLGGIAAVLVAAVLTWLLAFSSVFGVGTVEVRGEHVLSAARIRTAAAVPHGTPLLRLDTASIARRVETVPGVAAAVVRTSFPSTVLITVTERVAVGVVRSGTGYALVDATGDQFRTVTARPRGLPLFVVPAGTDARTTGGAVATVASALTPALRAQVASVQALDPNAITLLLTDQRVVQWGSAARSADKARILPALLRGHVSQVDVSDPDQPFTR
ncbi:MAG: cell division protein FtsQ/DivIB [Jatrophihabitantaceae bacterium]